MKIKNVAQTIGSHALTGILTIGVIIAFGVLSASGMMLVLPATIFVVSAFIFGGVVEGEVFNQEIFAGLKDLKLLGKHGYRTLITDALELYIKQQNINAGLLFEYQRLKKYLKDLRGKKLTEAQKSEKKHARKRLKHMQEYIFQKVMKNQNVAIAAEAEDETLSAAITAMQNQMLTFRAKMTFFRIALPVSILCGAGFGFATAAGLPAALAAIGLAASLSFMVWPLAAMAAIGYTFLIFHTAKDILFSDSFRKWKASIKKYFVPGPEGVTAKFVFKAAAITLVAAATVALCVMGTLATAGTWWLAVKHGAKLLPYIHNAATIIRNILAPIAAFGNFVFSVFNSFESLEMVIRTVQNAAPIRYLREQWQQLRAQENIIQILNPFRIVSKFIQKVSDAVFLLGHVLASGTARDQFMNISPTILAATTAGSELTQDMTFFFEEGKKTMIQKLVTFVLSPLLFLSAVWQFSASRCNSPEHRVSFVQACKDAFGIVTKPAYAGDDAPPITPAVRQIELNHYFRKEEQRLEKAVINRTIAQEKTEVLGRLKNDLLFAPALDAQVALDQDDLSVLNRHRLFQRNDKPTTSAVFANKMINRFS